MEHKYSQEEFEAQKVRELAVSRVCSINEVQHRSMTIECFFDKLHTMVDDFYSAKA